MEENMDKGKHFRGDGKGLERKEESLSDSRTALGPLESIESEESEKGASPEEMLASEETLLGDSDPEEDFPSGDMVDPLPHAKDAMNDTVVESVPQSDAQITEERADESGGKKPRSTALLIIGGVVAAVAIVSLILYFFVHDWSEATCTEPMVCSICGATQGEPLGHDWIEADCANPKKCSRCGQTEGSPLGHDMGDWIVDTEPTCSEVGKRHRFCNRCGNRQDDSIAKLPHTPGDWVTQTEPSIDDEGNPVPGMRVKTCTVCGEIVESEEIRMSVEEATAAYKNSCAQLTFEQVARDPDTYQGTRARFTGEVIQVLQSGNDYTLRVNVTPVSYGYTDTIMVSYTAEVGAPRILEDDVVTLYGEMGGMYTYESIFGADITVPLMFAKYLDM